MASGDAKIRSYPGRGVRISVPGERVCLYFREMGLFIIIAIGFF